VGYDAYSGFGRMRMVIPTLTPEPNNAPFANAGKDQIVPDKGKPGEEWVTLDGSGSYDLDGAIISYEWFEDGNPIATGETATVKLPVDSHLITLRVTDDQFTSSEDEVSIEITAKNGDLPNEGGGSAPATDMGVYDMIWSAKNNLDLTVNIRRDSNGDQLLTAVDEPVSEASALLILTHNDGISQNSWTFQGLTDASGNFRAKVPRAPAGTYQAEITGLSHDIHEWNPDLDTNYTDSFIK